jgi:hypothetical protein
LQHNLTVIH